MSDRCRRPVIAVSLGDPGGIGPEVALKAWADEGLQQQARLLLVGSVAVVREHAEALGRALPPLEVVQDVPETFGENGSDDTLYVLDVTSGDAPEVTFGEVSAAAGRLSMRAVERAVDLCRTGAADAMTTAPISKAAIARAGYRVPGHTEFIAERTGGAEPLMLMVGRPASESDDDGGASLRVGLVSVHEPLASVPRSVTAEAIRGKLGLLAESLRRDFGLEAPRIAALGLNPHAGDDGALGAEERDLIAPALEAARRSTDDEGDGLAERGVRLDGPVPADGFFGTRGWECCDAVLAMYHDQGLAPFKALTFGGGVNVTAGLPVVRTSPDHGTAFDIAGEGRAHPGSMKSALRLAAAISERRRTKGG
jgi:4-hydroxythreonine-4-phosphate dehydrogenase